MVLVSLLVLALLAAAGSRIPGGSLARAIAERIVCAARLSTACGTGDAELVAAYGTELAGLVRDHAPRLRYERGMRALPVDYRRCREDACAEGAPSGQIWRSLTGEPVVAFVHVVDCRAASAARTERGGMDCSADRAGNLYLQYWFYYPGSATGEGSTPLKGAIRTASSAVGKPSHHRDDWESFQVRIEPGGRRYSRASSHHGYGPGWVPGKDRIYVAGGSHAGRAEVRDAGRTTKDDRLILIPLAEIARTDSTPFAVTPPWRKRVYLDPEYEGTD